MAKIKEVVLDCTKQDDDLPERIYIKAHGGKWYGHYTPYSMYTYKDSHHVFLKEGNAKEGMSGKDILIEYVAVTKYRCRIESCKD